MSKQGGGESDDRGQAPEGTIHTKFHDWSGDGPLSSSVVRAVAAVSGKEPTAVQPLYDVVDLDALENLFLPGPNEIPVTEGTVSFVLDGLEVTVHTSGEIVVTSQE